MPDPEVIVAMTRHKAALLANEQEQMRAMAARWIGLQDALEAQIAALAEEFARRRSNGETLTQGALFRMERYQRLLAQLQTELRNYTDFVAPLIESQQRQYAQLAIQHAATAIDASITTRIGAQFDRLPIEAVEHMVGLAGDGSPLRQLLVDAWPEAADGLTRELIRSTALGVNPRETARRMADGTTRTLTRMLNIARTEQMRVYTETSRQAYIRSGVVKGYRRLATRSDRTCPGCLAADGEEYPLDVPFQSHASCRCTTIPVVIGMPTPQPRETTEQWFGGQSEQTQRNILGKGRYELWKSGQVSFSDLATLHRNQTWGDSVQPTSLASLRAGRGGLPKQAPISKPFLDNGFPADLGRLQHVRNLGGSTGATLVRDPENNRLYVRKMGRSPEHLREEVSADRAYRALGVNVPGLHLYDTPEGPVKLAEFVEGKPLNELRRSNTRAYKKAVTALQKDFVADALLGNRDVIGMDADNIIVDKSGKVWRIDNGGSLRFRAQGQPKGDFNQYPLDLWSMRNSSINAQAASVYGDLSYTDILKQMRALGKREGALMDVLTDDLRPLMQQRMGVLAEIAKTGKTLIDDQWTDNYTDNFSRHWTQIRAAGITDRYPTKLTHRGVDIFDTNGKPFDDLRGPQSVMGEFAQYLDRNGGRYSAITHWMERQASDSWTGASQATKYFYASRRGDLDNYYWHRGVDKARGHYEGALQAVGRELYEETFTAWHAFNYDFVRSVDFAKNNRRKGTIELIRTENEVIMQTYGLKPGDTGRMKRGAAESTSIYQEVRVFGTEVTIQHVPYHRILGLYFFERAPRSSISPFLGDRENEFVAMMDGLDVYYKPARRR